MCFYELGRYTCLTDLNDFIQVSKQVLYGFPLMGAFLTSVNFP